MPKRSKIVSGKVIAAVAHSKAKAEAESAASVDEVPESTAAPTAPASIAKEIDYSVDLKTRFLQRKEDLQQQRHADSEDNLRRLKKRREKEEKKKQRAKLQKRPIDGTAQDLESVKESKKVKADQQKQHSSALVVEEGDLQFNRLDERDLSKPNTEKPKKKALNPKVALQKLESEKAKLQKLKESDPEKAATLQAKLETKKALQKAQGIAVKDNEALLKKSIARREKIKDKSRQLWEKKKEELKQKQDERQAKREENIQARIEAKKAKGKNGKKVQKPKAKGKGKGKGNKFSKKPRK